MFSCRLINNAESQDLEFLSLQIFAHKKHSLKRKVFSRDPCSPRIRANSSLVANLITSRNHRVVTDLERGMEAYTVGNNDQAIHFLTSYLNSSGTDKGAKLYFGIASMHAGSEDLAAKSFSDLRSDPRYGQQAEWYLGLLNLKMNNEQQAAEIFQRITKDVNHYRSQDARQILKKKGM